MGSQRKHIAVFLIVSFVILLCSYGYAASPTSENESRTYEEVDSETIGTETSNYSYGTYFIALFSAILGSFLGPYFTEKLARSIFAPKLEPFFNFSQTFCHKTKMYRKLKGYQGATGPQGPQFATDVSETSEGATGPNYYATETSLGATGPEGLPPFAGPIINGAIEIPVYYFRFGVVNNGKTQAKKCEVVLENIWTYDETDMPIKHKNISPLRMNWSISHEKFIDINPKRRYYCDLCHIELREELRCVLDLNEIIFAQPNFLPPGKHELQFGIYSENAEYKEIYFEISWSGNWKDDETEMLKEIVIRRK